MGGSALKTWFSVTIVDDRGVEHHPTTLSDVQASAGRPGHPPKEVFERLGRLGHNGAASLKLSFLPRVAIWLLLYMAIYSITRVVTLFLVPPPLDAPLAVVAAIVIMRRISRALVRRRLRGVLGASMVAEGVCGVCGYLLREIAPDQHGLLQCPECGAAWQQDRIVRPCWQTRREAAAPPLRRSFLHHLSGRVPVTDVDDVGRATEYLDSRLAFIPPERLKAIGKARAHELMNGVRRAGRLQRWSMIAALALIMELLVFIVLTNWRKYHGYDWPFAASHALSCALIAALGGYCLLRTEYGLPPSLKRRVLLPQGHCPACLEPIPPCEGQLVFCACCGSGWSRSAIAGSEVPGFGVPAAAAISSHVPPPAKPGADGGST
jgi:hypothetical protein